MIFEFIPVAEASVEILMKSINEVVINPIIFFLFALAMVYFLYGVAQYLLNPENEEVRKTSKSHMIYGIFGLFIMVAVFGIMRLILNTLGERRIRIQNTGDYEVDVNNKKYNFDPDIANEKDLENYAPKEVDITTDKVNISGESVNLTKYDKSPFLIKYIENPLCWRREIHDIGSTSNESIKNVKELVRTTYLKENNIVSSPTNINLPLNFDVVTSFDGINNVYHAWMDARAPIGKGTIDNCVLQTSDPQYMSNGQSPFTNHYISDSLFVRIVASGVDNALQLARELAIKKAFALIGIEIQDVNTMTIVYPTARILEEKYITNPVTGKYEYWVAVESRKISDVVYESTKASPFTKKYESDSLFERVVNYATNKNVTTARDTAINNALIELSKKVDPNDVSKGVQLMIILEEKQIFNEKTGEYEYWVAIEGSKSVEGSSPAGESSKVAPFSKIYKTDSSHYRVVASGVNKDLSMAKDLAINNGLIKLKNEIGDALTGSKAVVITEEKQTFNSITGNYEYWVALEVLK